jgi:predicted RNase H-like HicB family nuclease
MSLKRGLLKMTPRTFRFIVERHSDDYLAYPLGLKGVVVGQGDSFEAALHDAESALQAHIEAFGAEALDDENKVDAAYVAEADVNVAESQGCEG